ncbi:hypothetical protein VKT23_020162 [Stygiomarasmius scandens]|uniref:Uncharacterized protein n=1 Tax=Marasmiellus scandens TaxID=2682957 RepID=A0ABR1IJK2_9AGAR
MSFKINKVGDENLQEEGKQEDNEEKERSKKKKKRSKKKRRHCEIEQQYQEHFPKILNLLIERSYDKGMAQSVANASWSTTQGTYSFTGHTNGIPRMAVL